MIPKINSAHGSDTRNILNRAIDLINAQGKSIQELVAEGQLTPSQYAQLVSIVNDNVKKGSITTADIDKNNFAVDQTMVTDELRRQITGNAPINAVPANNSLTTEKYVDDSVTKAKKTIGGETASVLTWNKVPDIDLENRKMTFYANTAMVHSKGRSVISTDMTVDFTPGRTTVFVFDISTSTFRSTASSNSNRLDEDEVFVAHLSFTTTSQRELINVVGNFEYTVNGKNRILDNRDIIGNENIKVKAIEENNTTFIDIGKNKFDGQYENYNIAGTPSNLNSMSLEISASNGKTGVIRIEPNKTYTVKKFEGGNRFRAGVFNRKITPTSTPAPFDRPLFHPEDEITNKVQEFTFTNDGKGMYLYIYVGLIDDTSTINVQVEEGEESTDFEPYTASLKKGIRTITTKQDLSDDLTFELAFQRKMINNTWEIGTLHGMRGDEINSISRVRTGFIEMKAGQVIKAIENDELEGFYPHKYDLFDQTFTGSPHGYLTEYTVQEDCYVRLVSKFKDEREITSIEDFRSQFYIELLANTNSPVRGNNPILFGDFTTLYKTTPIEGASVGDSFDLGASLTDDIYAEVDGLMNEFPDLLTKDLVGYGSDENGDDDTNLPIYEYTLTPPNRTLRYGSRPVKTLLMTGLHGEEKSTVWSTLHFFKQMLNDWKTNDSLASIKANMEFRWIPIANPYGFNTHQRLNARGVDPNRNFSHNWDAETATTKGSQAYSEIETRLLRDWMVVNNDADFFIDFHNFSKEKPDLSYIDTMSPELQNVYTSLIRRLSDVWRRDYTLDNDNMLYGTISNDNRPMSFREAYHVAGIELSTIIEITMFWGGVKYTQEIMEMGADLIGNYFLALLNAHDRIFK